MISMRVSGTHRRIQRTRRDRLCRRKQGGLLRGVHPHSTGCGVVAVDLQTGEQLWRHQLKGLGPINHSQYRNQVVLEIDESTVRVLGKESAGRSVEYVDRDSGRTVA